MIHPRFDSGPLEELLRRSVDAGPIVGSVIAVSIDGNEMCVLPAGMVDREAERRMEPNAVFRLASLTKAVVCVAALAMVEDGLLSLEAPVTDWLPWFAPVLPSGERPVMSLANLMTHQSGLGYGFGQAAGTGYDAAGISDGLDDCGLTLEANMRRLAACPLFDRPGTNWRYSLGIDLLGLVMEVAAGKPLGALVAERVTQPLGMVDTRFMASPATPLVTPYADGAPDPVRMARAHGVPMGQGLIRFAPGRAWDSTAFPSGGTGLIGTARDYARFLEAVRQDGGPLLTRAMAQRFVTHDVGDAVVGMAGSGMGWGLGVAIMRDPAAVQSPMSPGSWMWGGVYGNSYWVDPAARLSVVALTNTAIAGMAGPFPDAVKRAVYAGLPG